MRANPGHIQRRIVEYDALRHRLWILGQRCHHGATGSVVATVAFVRLLADPSSRHDPVKALPSIIAMVAAGGAMMAHDWKDHDFWFELGHGTQP